MSFLDKTGLQTLTNKLVQGDAIKVASHRGHTVKNVIDNIQRECDNVANPLEYKIENRVADFKIGKGRDVDVSGDIENGCTEVELQGKTYQNLFGSKLSIGDKWVETESDYSLILPVGNGQPQIFHNLSQPLKPNTTYTLIFDFVRFNSGALFFDFRNDENNISMGNQNIADNSIGIKVRKITTPSENVATKFRMFNVNNKDNDFAFKKHIVILEGDYTQTPIEELPQYFEGIKSSFEDGIVDVEVQGKNLLNIKHKTLEVQGLIIEANEEKQQFIVNGSATGDAYVYFCGGTWKSELNDSITNTNYSLTILTDGDVDVKSDRKDLLHVQMGYKDENNVSKSYFDKRVAQLGEVKCGLFRTGDYRITSPWFRLDKGNVYKNFVIKLQIQHQANTSYEPCYKKKISFNIDEPLRSLPNGVCDEIRNNNGQWELVRRCGKTILNGKEEWQFYIENTNTIRCLYTISAMKMTDKYLANMICDLFKVVPNSEWGNDTEQIEQGWTRSEIGLRINKTKLSSQDVTGFKQWLSKNPTTVYYELTTPIITPIEPIEFDVKPLATMTINSEIAPISNHKVVLNRAGQIEQGIIQIAELKKRVDVLETAYDSYLLETQHKLSILGFEYELESEEI